MLLLVAFDFAHMLNLSVLEIAFGFAFDQNQNTFEL